MTNNKHILYEKNYFNFILSFIISLEIPSLMPISYLLRDFLNYFRRLPNPFYLNGKGLSRIIFDIIGQCQFI